LPKFGPNTSVMKTKAWETVRVLPNPAKDLVQIALPDYVTGVNVSVVDITGKQVLNTTLQVNTGKTILNMSSLNRGVYILRISDGTHAYQTKLVLAE
jgi:extracellular elastinolytic metalloproteinase